MSVLKEFEADLRLDGFSATTLRTYLGMLRRVPHELPGTLAEAKTYLATIGGSPNSVRVHVRALKAFGKWHSLEYGSDNELERLRYPKPVTPPPGRIAREDDLDRILGGLRASGPAALMANARDIAIVTTFAETGCRRGELCKLTVADVDLESRKLTFRETKTGDGRIVPMTDALHSAMRRWMRVRREHPLSDLSECFLGERGPLQPNGVGQLLQRLCKRYGVDPRAFTSHMLRRRLAHRWVERGGADDSLMAIAGWRSFAMPSMYRRELLAQRAGEDFARIMKPDRPKITIKR